MVKKGFLDKKEFLVKVFTKKSVCGIILLPVGRQHQASSLGGVPATYLMGVKRLVTGIIMKTGTIYLYAFPNGKNYVGQTWDWERRCREHKSECERGVHRNPIFQACYDKYRLPVPSILYRGIETQSELDRLEALCFGRFGSHYKTGGCNLLSAGSCGRHSELSKKKISDANRGIPKTQAHREKLSVANLGKKHSPETCEKMSRSRKGQMPWIKGKKHSRATRQKIGDALRGRKTSSETREKMRQSQKKRFRKEKYNPNQLELF